MSNFQFDAWVSLERARQGLPIPNRPNPPNRHNKEDPGLGRLGGIGTVGTSKEFLSVDPETLAVAVDHFEERSAIRQYDGGQHCAEAEAAAMNEVEETYEITPDEIRDAIAANLIQERFDE